MRIDLEPLRQNPEFHEWERNAQEILALHNLEASTNPDGSTLNSIVSVSITDLRTTDMVLTLEYIPEKTITPTKPITMPNIDIKTFGRIMFRKIPVKPLIINMSTWEDFTLEQKATAYAYANTQIDSIVYGLKDYMTRFLETYNEVMEKRGIEGFPFTPSSS